MKKKILTMGLLVGLALSLAGCGSGAAMDAGGGATAQKASEDFAAKAENTGDAWEASQEDAMQKAAAPEDTAAETVDVPAESGGVQSGQKRIRTVNMTAETTDFDRLVSSVKDRTEELGGYVERSELNAASGSAADRWINLVLRVPAKELDGFVTQIGEEANVTYSSESTEDVTLSYVDMESHLTALRTEQETLMSMLEQAKTMEDILTIQTRLTDIRYQIESYESQIRVCDNQVEYGTVNLDIAEVIRETSAAGTTFGQSVRARFGDNLYLVGRGLRNFAIGFLGAVPILIPVAGIAAALVWVLRHVRKIRKKRTGEKQ